MTDKEFFVETLKAEMGAFERVLKAVEKVPKSKLSYRPDPRSRTAFELISQTMGMESGMMPIILKKGQIDFSSWPKPKWKTVESVRKEFMKQMKVTEKMVEKMNQKDWISSAQMVTGKKVDWQSTKGKMVWGFLFDLIHHRGQLATYIRPMGGKVPSIYGPSADSNG